MLVKDQEKLLSIVKKLHLKIEAVIREEMRELEKDNGDFLGELIFVLLRTFGNLLATHCMTIDTFGRNMGIEEKLNHTVFLQVINQIVAEHIALYKKEN
jgi:hypothetical protein